MFLNDKNFFLSEFKLNLKTRSEAKKNMFFYSTEPYSLVLKKKDKITYFSYIYKKKESPIQLK